MIIEEDFRFFGNGTYGCKNLNKPPTHAVLLVGYKRGVGFKLKNSFGVQWGEAGYFFMDQNSCKVCNIGFYPVPFKDLGLKNYK